MTTDPLALVAAAHPNDVAILDRGHELSYGDFNELVNRVAHRLVASGAAPGQRIAWSGRNRASLLVLLHAVRKAGLTDVPIPYQSTSAETEFLLHDSQAALLVTERSLADMAPPSSTVPTLVYGEEADPTIAWAVAADMPNAEPVAIDDGDGSSVIYTSGSSGRPKGVRRGSSDPTFVSDLRSVLRLGAEDEIHLVTAPLFHAGPQGFALVTSLRGGKVIIEPSVDGSRWLHLVKSHHVTSTFVAPIHLRRILAAVPSDGSGVDLSSMRTLIANAAPIPYELKVSIIEKLGAGFLFELYGSTELGVTTVLEPEDQLRKPGSCGRPFGDVRLRIEPDLESTGRPDAGVVFVSTPARMQGYSSSGRVASDQEESDTWLTVGDLGYIDDEGFLYLIGRNSEVIISGGENVHPSEVEAALLQYPGVDDVAVVGVPDEEYGERVHAFVTALPGHDLTPDHLRDHAASQLAPSKRPRTWDIVEALPRTDAGKLLRSRLPMPSGVPDVSTE